MATAKKLGEVCWLHPESKGEGPTPRSGHSISCIDGKAIVFGGCGVSADGLSQEIYNDTWELHIGEGDSPSWHLADAMGDLPNPRWRHTATVLPDSGGILLFENLQERCIEIGFKGRFKGRFAAGGSAERSCVR